MAAQANKEELARRAVDAYKQVTNQTHVKTMPEWLQLDMSIGQIKALFAIGYLGSTTVGGLAEILHIGQSATSILIDRLVHHGLVERREDPEDRRRTFVTLSP